MKWSFMGSDIRQMMNEPQDPLFITPQMIEDLKKQNKTGPQIIASQTDIQRHGLTIIFSVSGPSDERLCCSGTVVRRECGYL